MTNTSRIDVFAAFSSVDQLRELLAEIPGTAQVSIDVLPEGVRFDSIALLTALDDGELAPMRVARSELHRVTSVCICEASGVGHKEGKSMEATDEVYQILRDAKVLAKRYYHLTNKPLGLTGEIAEYEAARILDLELEFARQAGYDATEVKNGSAIRIQIKGRYFSNPQMRGGRVGSIDLKQTFDTVLLVLLDADYNAFQIYEAARPAVEALLTRPGSKARNERGSVGISQFKAISALRWERAGP